MSGSALSPSPIGGGENLYIRAYNRVLGGGRAPDDAVLGLLVTRP